MRRDDPERVTLGVFRPRPVKVEAHSEGRAYEFSRHHVGQVDVRFVDENVGREQFFASRLESPRWAGVTLVQEPRAGRLVRTLREHFVAFGELPLCAVFDRPETVALAWGKRGKGTTWNPLRVAGAMDIGFAAKACWLDRRSRRVPSRSWSAG